MNDNNMDRNPNEPAREDVFSLSEEGLDKLIDDILSEAPASSDPDIREAQNILESSATANLSIWDTAELTGIPNLSTMDGVGKEEESILTPEEISEFAQVAKEVQDARAANEEAAEIVAAPRKEVALPEPEEEEESDAPLRKRRPARKAGYGLLGIPQILTACVWIGLVLAIGISLGRVLWVCAEDVLAFNRQDNVVTVTIEEEDDMETVAKKLHEAGLVRYPKLFGLYADLSHAEEKISAGTHNLNTIYDYHALVSAMTHYDSAREVVTLTIPEGYNSYQIFRLLEDKGVCSAEDLGKWAAEGELDDYWFLENVDRGTPNCLEGFLFPDTYDFYVEDDADRVIGKLLSNFNTRFTDRLREDLDELNDRLASMWYSHGYGDDYVSEHAFNIQRLLTVASLVEKETSSVQEGYTIASVFYNRITDLGSYPFLNSDAALYYALGGLTDRELTADDMAIDSPYNTYTNIGLPPTPIANPSLNSIYAALYPDDTNYHYFVYDSDIGETHFSESLWEHENYIANME